MFWFYFFIHCGWFDHIHSHTVSNHTCLSIQNLWIIFWTWFLLLIWTCSANILPLPYIRIYIYILYTHTFYLPQCCSSMTFCSTHSICWCVVGRQSDPENTQIYHIIILLWIYDIIIILSLLYEDKVENVAVRMEKRSSYPFLSMSRNSHPRIQKSSFLYNIIMPIYKYMIIIIILHMNINSYIYIISHENI